MSTMKQYLAKSKLPGSALQPWFKDSEEHETEPRTGLVKENEEHETKCRIGVVSYDDYADDPAWRAEFGTINQDHQSVSMMMRSFQFKNKKLCCDDDPVADSPVVTSDGEINGSGALEVESSLVSSM
ncbi:unnamed protein product [Brassica rapa]|uniref:Uncharacterized protein n=1 Tax=Brassica campestris TaxID=3711 RepID=A0A8D9CZB5_BRACM|nr:unnamed protein product [Brassica rapa]